MAAALAVSEAAWVVIYAAVAADHAGGASAHAVGVVGAVVRGAAADFASVFAVAWAAFFAADVAAVAAVIDVAVVANFGCVQH